VVFLYFLRCLWYDEQIVLGVKKGEGLYLKKSVLLEVRKMEVVEMLEFIWWIIVNFRFPISVIILTLLVRFVVLRIIPKGVRKGGGSLKKTVAEDISKGLTITYYAAIICLSFDFVVSPPEIIMVLISDLTEQAKIDVRIGGFIVLAIVFGLLSVKKFYRSWDDVIMDYFKYYDEKYSREGRKKR